MMASKSKDITLEDVADTYNVGPLGKAHEFAEDLYAGFMYSAAVDKLITQQLEINQVLDNIEGYTSDVVALILTTEKEVEESWLLAMHMFGIKA
jgi:hypothetical protein